MSRMLITSDLHLGHRNIHKFREGFASAEEHHEIVFDKLATELRKRDSLWLLGDIAFTADWLKKISELECVSKVLVVGNHDLDRQLKMRDLVLAYDKIYSLHKKRNLWFSHCPIHPQEMRKKIGNIHGHTHDFDIDDPRYVNVCLEKTDFAPITFEKVQERLRRQLDEYKGNKYE